MCSNNRSTSAEIFEINETTIPDESIRRDVIDDVSQVPSGKYYVSILLETEHEELLHREQKTKLL